jgi:CRP/FNR family cyclic AMP-dependent transcriptional regulator
VVRPGRRHNRAMTAPYSTAVRLFLAEQAWFNALSPEFQARVGNACTVQRGSKGEVLLQSGQPVEGWYAVLTGLVKLQSCTDDGRVSAFLGVPAGEWFGEGSALKSEVRRYEVIALRDTTVMCLPLEHFQALFRQDLTFNQCLVAHLNRRLGQAMAVVEAGRLRSPEQRVALYLSRLFWPGARQLALSQEELGHLAGLARQTVNRALGALEEQGLITLEFGRVTILDEAALTAVALMPPRRRG